MIEGSDGALYGTTTGDGAHGAGSVFKVNKDGSGFVSLYDFSRSGDDACYPEGGVMEASNGRLYGTTIAGGPEDWGALFTLNKDGSGYAVLHFFTPENGGAYSPASSLVEGPGGILYGTTYFGGVDDAGTLYTVNPSGTGLSIIHEFYYDGREGWGPYSEMTWARDGALYGSTFAGGSLDFGTLYRIKPVALKLQPSAGGVTVALSGFIGHAYAVEMALSLSNSLASAWTELGTITNATGRVEWFDPDRSAAAKFYRARVLPRE